MKHSSTDTLIIGAGPYGLSVSAHLRDAGVDHRVLGKPMDTWRRMPDGMHLRSSARASSLSDPKRGLTLEAFHTERATRLESPVPLEAFLQYCDWFTARAGIDIDQRLVKTLARCDGGFLAILEDQEMVWARRVVLAVGAQSFQSIPPEFGDLPAGVVCHVGDQRDLGAFAGKELVIVGAGQSAIECAALAYERGAKVTVVFRASGVRWLTRSARLHSWPLVRSLLYSPSDIGPPGLSRLVSAPGLFALLPVAMRERATARCTRAAAAAWLVERTDEIPFRMGCRVRGVASGSDRVRVECEGASSIEADHVLLATGYDVDLARYSFLTQELLDAIGSVGGFPILKRGFESSVAGLHIVGWPATRTYGPLMRHVCGVDFTARRTTAVLAKPTGTRVRSRAVHFARTAGRSPRPGRRPAEPQAQTSSPAYGRE